jgi:hypothetical protein
MSTGSATTTSSAQTKSSPDKKRASEAGAPVETDPPTPVSRTQLLAPGSDVVVSWAELGTDDPPLDDSVEVFSEQAATTRQIAIRRAIVFIEGGIPKS